MYIFQLEKYLPARRPSVLLEIKFNQPLNKSSAFVLGETVLFKAPTEVAATWVKNIST
jgi:hypothetical protein